MSLKAYWLRENMSIIQLIRVLRLQAQNQAVRRRSPRGAPIYKLKELPTVGTNKGCPFCGSARLTWLQVTNPLLNGKCETCDKEFAVDSKL